MDTWPVKELRWCSSHYKVKLYKLCAYSLLQTECIELFQLEQKFLLQQAFLSFQLIVSDDLGFRFLHIYTVSQIQDRNQCLVSAGKNLFLPDISFTPV